MILSKYFVSATLPLVVSENGQVSALLTKWRPLWDQAARQVQRRERFHVPRVTIELKLHQFMVGQDPAASGKDIRHVSKQRITPLTKLLGNVRRQSGNVGGRRCDAQFALTRLSQIPSN